MATIWYNNDPNAFGEQVKKAIDLVENKNDEHKIIFLMSWNEWAEGNYMEPDLKFGKAYLSVLKKVLTSE